MVQLGIYSVVGYWGWLGLMYLTVLTYSDYKNNMRIDDRKNWFMMGVTMSLLSHLYRGILYVLVAIVIVFLLRYLFIRYNTLGEGDINSIMWCFLGFAFIGIPNLLLFGICLILFSAMYWLLKVAIFKIKAVTPFYPVILASFLVTVLLRGII